MKNGRIYDKQICIYQTVQAQCIVVHICQSINHCGIDAHCFFYRDLWEISWEVDFGIEDLDNLTKS